MIIILLVYPFCFSDYGHVQFKQMQFSQPLHQPGFPRDSLPFFVFQFFFYVQGPQEVRTSNKIMSYPFAYPCSQSYLRKRKNFTLISGVNKILAKLWSFMGCSVSHKNLKHKGSLLHHLAPTCAYLWFIQMVFIQHPLPRGSVLYT